MLLSRDRIKRIERWAREGLSAAEMQRRSRSTAANSGIRTILKYATPVWEEMAAEGVFCGCGERLGHVGLCAATWASRGRIRGPQPVPVDEQVRIINALLSGESIVAIRRTVKVSEMKVLRIFRAMTAQERHKRAIIVRRRIGDDDGQVHGFDLYERVRAVVPATLEINIRDEVISELCLAVLQHDLTIDDIRQHAQKFVGRAFTSWSNGFGPRSLDDALFEDGDGSLHDVIGDDTSVSRMDDFAIGSGR